MKNWIVDSTLRMFYILFSCCSPFLLFITFCYIELYTTIRRFDTMALLDQNDGAIMNKYFVDAMCEDNFPDGDMLYYLIGMHCWCGQHTQDLSKYNMYDVAMGY